MLKKSEINREESLTIMLEVNVTKGYLMKVNSSIQPFDFATDVTNSTIRNTTVNTLVVTASNAS